MYNFRLREKLALEEPYEDMCTLLADDVVFPEETIQKSAAKALHKTLSHHPDYITATIAELKDKYQEKLYVGVYTRATVPHLCILVVELKLHVHKIFYYLIKCNIMFYSVKF